METSSTPRMFNFERLDVWRKSVEFAGLIYGATKGFPADERFGLTNQIRRAATSIASNIAEGSSRPRTDFARFIGYASGSLSEVITQATVAKNEGMLDPTSYQQIYSDGEEIGRMLSGLRGSLGD